MCKKFAVLLDTVSIQNYVFQSNKLKENLGASFLVKTIYGDYLKNTIREIFNNTLPQNFNFDSWRKNFEKVQEPVDVGYIGGGNALLLFTDEEKACQFVKAWTKLLLIETPGIVPTVAIKEIDFAEANFKEGRKELFMHLKKNKSEYPAQTTLLRHGITAECNHTGLSAEKWEESNKEYISSVAYAKIAACDLAKKDIPKSIQKLLGDNYCFTDLLDQLGQRSGEDSHIAVVHIDGNDIGKRFTEVISLKALRQLSVRIEETTQTAFEILLQHIVDNYDKIINYLGFASDFQNQLEEKWPPYEFTITNEALIQLQKENLPNHYLERLKVFSYMEKSFTNEDFMEKFKEEVKSKDFPQYRFKILSAALKKKVLPIRSIILGGDDITFVCDGKLGIYFAQVFMEAFQKLAPDLTTCGGVAIVKTKYPFYRAYHLAEEICSSAKRYRRNNCKAGSFIDFHVSMGGFAGSLENIRNKYCTVPQGNLLLRPYELIENDRDEQSFYSLLHNTWQLEQTYPNNKINEMIEVLTLTEVATDRFMQTMNNRHCELSNLKAHDDFKKRMFVEIHPKEKNTIFFDMIEMLNFYPFKLRGEKSWKIIN